MKAPKLRHKHYTHTSTAQILRMGCAILHNFYFCFFEKEKRHFFCRRVSLSLFLLFGRVFCWLISQPNPRVATTIMAPQQAAALPPFLNHPSL
jgi:hypothetical protein